MRPRALALVTLALPLALGWAAPRAARAQPLPDAPPPPEQADEAPEAPADPREEIVELRQRIDQLETRLDQTQQIATLRRPIVSVGGYVDFGFFVAGGNGVGVIQDEGPNRVFPRYANQYSWVFLGDLLAPMVNSRGESASLGNFPGVNRFDSVDSDGAPTFIVNEVNLTLNAALARNALATASVDFMPRSGIQEFSLGDFMEVDIAELEWEPFASGKTSVFVGKFDSVLGIEYRDRKSTQRFGVTPSLIARYTTGTPLGLKVRSKLGDDERVVVAAAVTNGSSSIEAFHFYDEIDTNSGKTVSGRVSVRPFPLDLQVGLSGSWGPQDHAIDNTNAMWFVGADLLAHIGSLDIKGQYLKGGAPGLTAGQAYDPRHVPYGLALHHGGYLELDWMATPLVGLLARGDVRDADVWLGNASSLGGGSRLYLTRNWRATAGVRIVVNEHIVAKAEYLHNGEYDGIPQIPDDVFTSSLVLSY